MTKVRMHTAQKIRVWRIIGDAYLSVLVELPTFIRVAAAPVILTYLAGFLVGFAAGFSGNASEMTKPYSAFSKAGWCLQWVILSPIFAVAWHRFVLLGPEKARTTFGFDLTRRELAFIAYASFFALLVWLPHLIAASGLAGSLLYEDGLLFNWLIALLLMWPAFASFAVARLVMILPATAIEHPVTLKQSWKMTRGMTWRLIAIGWMCGFPFAFLNKFLSSNASALATSALAQFGLDIALLAGSFMHIGVAAAAVSLSFRWIVQSQLTGAATSHSSAL